jgi:hypothetical protein
MPFSVEDFHDLVRLLEARPEWRPELRRLVLSDELLALPEQLTQFRSETEQRFRELLEAQRRTDIRLGELAEAQGRTETRLAELADAQGRTETRLGDLAEAQQRTEARLAALADIVGSIALDVARLAVDPADMKGDILEMRYRRRAHSYFGRLIRRTHVLTAQELADLVDDAAERGRLTEAERDDVLLCDIVVRGRLIGDTRSEVYLLVEVSWGVGPDDVRRAVRRAGILEKLGTPVRPVVAGKTLTAEAAEAAREHRVWQVLDGQALAP